jgi:hypothetical protein
VASGAARYARPIWLTKALQRSSGWLKRREFWMFAAAAGMVVAVFDAFYLRGVESLVFATVLLGEGTAFLAVGSFYSGHQQRQTNVHLEAILAAWLAEDDDEQAPPRASVDEGRPPV